MERVDGQGGSQCGARTEEAARSGKAKLTAMEEFVGGWVGGLARIPVGHILDTVKVNQSTNPGKYTSMVHCFRSLVAEHGFLGLYKGVQSPALGMAALNGTLYFSLAQGKAIARWLDTSESDRAGDADGPREATDLSKAQLVVAGAFAGACTSLVEGPVDLIKTQLQLRHAEYSSVFHCARVLVETNGLRGMFQGLGPTLVRNTFGYILFFEGYEATCHAFRSVLDYGPHDDLPVWQVLTAGWVAGTLFWGVPYPADHIKTRMQGDTPVRAIRAFPTIAATLRHVLATEGLRGLYRGFVPCIVRAGPANACAWAGYEYTVRLFGYLRSDDDDDPLLYRD